MTRPRPHPSDLEACKVALRALDIAIDDAPPSVERKSRDFYWYSPVLKRQLDDIRGDFIATPVNEDQIRSILATCYAHDVPVTVRGAGTGNYGQAMPLCGGCVLHTAKLNQVIALDAGQMTAQPGVIMKDLGDFCHGTDRELRLFPSTVATATIGGFIAGGSSGVGAIRWGGLRNPANIIALRVMTMEAEPRIIELTGPDVYKAAHAYGVNGVITAITIPIDPAREWCERIVGLPDMAAATQFAIALGEAQSTILTRMISVFESPIPDRYFLRHKPHLANGEAAVAVLVDPANLAAFDQFCTQHGAEIRFVGETNTARVPPLYEIAWNHTTLRAMKVDPGTTYLQMMLPGDDPIAALAAIKARFGDELMMHLELTRIQGKVTAVGLPLVAPTTEARLEQIITELETELNVTVFNPHRVTLEEGGMKASDPVQVAFKRETDPKGLLNPGKMLAWDNPDWTADTDRTYLFARADTCQDTPE